MVWFWSGVFQISHGKYYISASGYLFEGTTFLIDYLQFTVAVKKHI